ncbi:MAG TPA: HD domain-containing protein [Candidatus Acidoferrales bacterium]|jgi:(p)ppGpp synthase/HD superfamily hydrolase|nr:HD domain-containing protein [Candidatus Acidoferrales bacterium]
MVDQLPLTARFRRALVYAARVHARQFRKGTTRPYIGHLLGVTAIVLTHGCDEDEAIAALLHDAVEDQGGKPRLREIRRKFGARVAQIVEGCTDSDVEPKPPWLERKTEYLRQLRHADSSVRLVSAADKVYNARETLEDLRTHRAALWKRFKGGKQGTLWYYREVGKILRRKGPKELAAELDRVARELTRAGRSRSKR